MLTDQQNVFFLDVVLRLVLSPPPPYFPFLLLLFSLTVLFLPFLFLSFLFVFLSFLSCTAHLLSVYVK